jgi:hypothetical protein
LWELGYLAQIESGSSTLQGELGDRFLWFVCMAPLWLRGIRGKKSTPSVGWDVPVRSQRLANRNWMEQKHMTTTSNSSSSVMVFRVKLLIVLRLNLYLHGCASRMMSSCHDFSGICIIMIIETNGFCGYQLICNLE